MSIISTTRPMRVLGDYAREVMKMANLPKERFLVGIVKLMVSLSALALFPEVKEKSQLQPKLRTLALITTKKTAQNGA